MIMAMLDKYVSIYINFQNFERYLKSTIGASESVERIAI